jgi:hypothetical protein
VEINTTEIKTRCRIKLGFDIIQWEQKKTTRFIEVGRVGIEPTTP